MSKPYNQIEMLQSCQRWFERFSPTADLMNGYGVGEHPMLTSIKATLAEAIEEHNDRELARVVGGNGRP